MIEESVFIDIISGFPIGKVSAVALGVYAVFKAVNIAKTHRRVVKPNTVHIVQKRNATINYGKGFDGGNAYWEWPEWIPFIGLTKIALPLSIFDLDLKNYEAYDEDKVPFMVDVKAFFVIDKPSVAAERISDMHELLEQLTGILQGTVRMVLAKHTVNKIMVDRSTFGELFTSETREQLKEWGVRNAKPIELMDIRDGTGSETITRIMAMKESKIEKDSRVEVAGNIKDAETAEIEATQIVDVRAQEAEQLVGERTAKKDKLVGIANEHAKQEIQIQAKITADRDMDVVRVKVVREANIKREAQVVKADEVRQTDIIDAEAAKATDVIKAEGTKRQTVVIAEGDLVDKTLEGKGILAVGQATAEAAKLLELARVDPELTLAAGIGKEKDYQDYLVRLRDVQKNEVVGVEAAKALQTAGIKVIANSGTVSNGMDSLMDIFSSGGGQHVGAALEGLAQTPLGEAVLAKLGVDLNGETDARSKL